MNKEAILAMEAGRKLDKLVAETIWGYEVKPINDVLCCWKQGELVGNLDDYSTGISAAWQVKEEMNRQGFHFRLAVYDEGDNQQAIFEKSGYEPFVAICPGTPEAICKAALLAKLETK